MIASGALAGCATGTPMCAVCAAAGPPGTMTARVVPRAVQILAAEGERAAEDEARGNRHEHHAQRLRLERLRRQPRRHEHRELLAALLALQLLVEERRLLLLRHILIGAPL